MLPPKKKGQLDKAHVHMHMGIFCNQEKMQPHSIFSPFWGENILVGSGRKHLGPSFIFLPSHLTKHTLKKKFLHIFSSKFFIYPVSKQTHQNDSNFNAINDSLLKW